MIQAANGVIVTVQHHNNPDTVVDQKARCGEKLLGKGNQLDNILLHGDRAPQTISWVLQQGYCPGKLLYSSHFSGRTNRGEANADGSVLWWMVHHDMLLVEDLDQLSCTLPNRTQGMKMCWGAPQTVRCIVDVSLVLTQPQRVPSGEDNPYPLTQFTLLESYNIIY